MNNEINSAEDANVYIHGCMDWPDPDKAGCGHMGGLLGKMKKGQYLKSGWDYWVTIYTAVFGFAFRRTKSGKSLVWDGAHIAVARNEELTRCHEQLTAIWGKLEALEKEREPLKAQLRQIEKQESDLQHEEKRLCQQAVDVLATTSPSYRENIIEPMRQRQERYRQAERQVQEQQARWQARWHEEHNLAGPPVPRYLGVGSAIRDKCAN